MPIIHSRLQENIALAKVISYNYLISKGMVLPTGNHMRAARALAGLTAGQLARLAGVDASTISRVESARHHKVAGQAGTIDRLTEALLKRGVAIHEDGVSFVRKGKR